MKLKQLKVRPKKILEASPCIAEMGALFECWATAGVDDKRCTAIAKSLTLCMGKPVKSQNKKKYKFEILTTYLKYRCKKQRTQTQLIIIQHV